MRAEVEGHTWVAQWRIDDESFWRDAPSESGRTAPDPGIDDGTAVALERFRLLGTHGSL